MALYPTAQTVGFNGINSNLFPFKVSAQLLQEWVQNTPLFNLMGDELSRPIVRKELGAGEGLQFRMGKLQALNYKNPVLNFEQRRGSEQQQQVDYDKIDVDYRTFSVKIKGFDILKLGTPIDLPSQARSQLVSVFARNLNYDLFNAMTVTAYPNILTAARNIAGTVPSYDRAVPALTTTRADWQLNTTFPTYLNGFQTSAATTPAGTGLSAKHLETLKQYAERGGSSVNLEDAIQPAFVGKKEGWPMNTYIYLAHPSTLTSLFSDPLFANSTFNRGTVIDTRNTPQLIDGSDYVGSYRGIHIYSCRDLYQYAMTSQDGTKTVAWNIFMGAGAVGVGWPKLPEIGMENDLYERIQIYFGHEFRGQKMLQFPSQYAATAGAVLGSNTVVEQGIIHSFVSF